MSKQEIVEVDGARFWTAQFGSGPAFVLCHGGPGFFDTLEPIAQMVDDVVTVYRYDQRACGRSTGNPPYNVDRFVDDLEALRQYWGLDRWIVGGHSWGANLAMAYCLKYPTRCKGLVYLSGTGYTWDWHDQYNLKQRDRLTKDQRDRVDELRGMREAATGDELLVLHNELLRLLWPTEFVNSEHGAMIDQYGLFDYPINWEVNKTVNEDWIRLIESSDTTSRLAELSVPALVVHGEEDNRPRWIAEQLSKLLPNADLVALPGAGHFAWLEQPALLRACLRDFLQKIG